MKTVTEAARTTAVVGEYDLCVIGGSCTGVFAAIAAARLGLSVALVESLAYLGGTATASMVCIWHSHLDTRFERQIIGGLSLETMERLLRRGAAAAHEKNESAHFTFRPADLAIELDRMVAAAGVDVRLHTRFVAPVVRDGLITHAIIEDKTGRRALAARMFVDATGDAELVHRAGFDCYKQPHLQPPTACFLAQGLDRAAAGGSAARMLRSVVFDPRQPEALKPGFLWSAHLPGSEDITMVAGTRVHGADCSDAEGLTAAEIEGRRQIGAIIDMVRRQPGGEAVSLLAIPARIGLRQGRQARCLHTLTEQEVLHGVRFDDAIANGSYRVDVHSDKGEGLIFRYLDGREVTALASAPSIESRWRADEGTATYYQAPYRSIVPRGAKNVLVAGRCLDADEGAYGAIRVMVNCNQLGEAAGTACAVAIQTGKTVDTIDVARLRATLADQGATVI